MKILNTPAYKDYKSNKSYYDDIDISEIGLALLDRFTPSTETSGDTYTCESVIVLSVEELVSDEGKALGNLWTLRRLIGVDMKKKRGITERYDIFVVSIGDQA